MTKNLVGAVPDDNLGIAQEVIRRLRQEEGFAERCRLFLDNKCKLDEGVEVVSRPFAKLERRLSRRFGHTITVDSYPKEFTPEFLAIAASYNMRPVFLPGEDIGEGRNLKKWVKPCQWFYEQVKGGSIKPISETLPPTQLHRGWYLADFTVSVDYTDGSQVFVDDPLASIIAKLREQKLVGRYDNTSMDSRFAITPDEWEDVVLDCVASKLGVTRAQVHLERAIEFNTIGNLYDFNRGKSNSWEWFQDPFVDSSRLCGGSRVRGGLSHVYYCWRDDRNGIIAARPLVSFVG